MSRDPTEMCQLLVGLPDVSVLAVVDSSPTTPLTVAIENARGDAGDLPAV